MYAGRVVGYGPQGATGVMQEWQKFVANQQRLGNDRPKLVCIDLQAYTTTQAPEREDRRGRIPVGQRGEVANDSGTSAALQHEPPSAA